jgi:hypothetical protein
MVSCWLCGELSDRLECTLWNAPTSPTTVWYSIEYVYSSTPSIAILEYVHVYRYANVRTACTYVRTYVLEYTCTVHLHVHVHPGTMVRGVLEYACTMVHICTYGSHGTLPWYYYHIVQAVQAAGCRQFQQYVRTTYIHVVRVYHGTCGSHGTRVPYSYTGTMVLLPCSRSSVGQGTYYIHVHMYHGTCSTRVRVYHGTHARVRVSWYLTMVLLPCSPRFCRVRSRAGPRLCRSSVVQVLGCAGPRLCRSSVAQVLCWAGRRGAYRGVRAQ